MNADLFKTIPKSSSPSNNNGNNHRPQQAQQQSYSPQYQPQRQNSPKTERYGISNGAWNVTLKITETLLDIIKSIMVVGGILAANLADVIFGTVGITILFGGSSALFNGTPVWVIGLILSMGASAIQIFLWSLIQKRGLSLNQLFNWKKLPSDIKGFMSMAFVVWFLDTLIDLSPVALLVQNSQYKTIEPLYWAMIASVSVIVFILCGFSEIMTSNMRGMLLMEETRKPNNNSSSQTYQSTTRDIPNSIPRK